MTITLPEPPSANRYWRVYRGRAVKSAEARNYGYVVERRVMAARGFVRPTGASPVAVTARWYRGAKRGDLDNRLKVLLDALCGYAFVDDSQVVELHAYRAEDKSNPRVEVTIEAAA